MVTDALYLCHVKHLYHFWWIVTLWRRDLTNLFFLLLFNYWFSCGQFWLSQFFHLLDCFSSPMCMFPVKTTNESLWTIQGSKPCDSSKVFSFDFCLLRCIIYILCICKYIYGLLFRNWIVITSFLTKKTVCAFCLFLSPDKIKIYIPKSSFFF